jgi:hypothetical protein
MDDKAQAVPLSDNELIKKTLEVIIDNQRRIMYHLAEALPGSIGKLLHQQIEQCNKKMDTLREQGF